MSTFYVRKNGSGTHTTIQSAIYVAVNGDTIDIGEGTFNENVELMGKSLTLQGAGKDKTVIQGKATNDPFTGCSYYGGESVVTMPSTSGLIVGKSVSGLVANTRISGIVSSTQFQTSIPTTTSGNITKTGVTWSSGSSTITLPSTTAVVVGMKVEGSGVNALVTAYNTTTRVVTLSSPTTQSGAAASLLFRKANVNVTVTQITSPSNSSGPASIMVTGISDGLVIKDLRAIGFENSSVGQEAAALFFTAGTFPGHTNFLIDNCWITADGDCAVLNGANPHLSNGTFQNCVIDGKTFQGSEPTDVPSFSTYISQGVVQSIGATTSVLEFSDMRGIIIGRTMTSSGSLPSAATVTAISGNSVTINKVASVSVGSSIPCTFTLTAYGVPNVARNLFYIGDNKYPAVTNTKNITFKNNVVSGQTGATISATGSKNMFNSAVTIESEGGLVENNVIDGIFGSGESLLLANFAIRCRQPGIVVQNNINKTSGGRQNSGFLVALGTSINNTTIDRLLVEVSQSSSNSFMESMMEKGALKANSKVSSHPVFSDESNWKLVNYVFKHDSSSRRLVSSFRSFDSSKKTKLKSNMKIGDKFELQKIIISKSDRTHLVIKRSEISGASAFDFNLLADGPVGSGGGPTQPALLTRTFSESAPTWLGLNEATQLIQGGNLVLNSEDNYQFTLANSLQTATAFNGSVEYKIKLTIASNESLSPIKINFAGGMGAMVTKFIMPEDFTNGYVEISGAYITPSSSNQIFIRSPSNEYPAIIRFSKMEINPVVASALLTRDYSLPVGSLGYDYVLNSGNISNGTLNVLYGESNGQSTLYSFIPTTFTYGPTYKLRLTISGAISSNFLIGVSGQLPRAVTPQEVSQGYVEFTWVSNGYGSIVFNMGSSSVSYATAQFSKLEVFTV